MKKRWISALFISAALLGAAPQMQAQSIAAGSYPRNLQAGIEYYQQGNYAAAKQSLLRFLAKAPQSDQTEEARYLICCCSYALQEAERTALMRQFVRRHPTSRLRYHVWGMLGATLFFEKDYEEAAEAFAHCKWEYLNDEKEAQDFRMQEAQSLLATGRIEQARAALIELRRQSEKYRNDCTYYLAYTDSDIHEALKNFLDLRSDTRYTYRASCRAADLYLKTRNYEKAIQTCPEAPASEEEKKHTQPQEEKLLQAEPARIKGEALFYLQKYPEAVAQLENYTRQVEKPSREALYALGSAYLRCDAPAKAQSILPQALQGETGDALAQSIYLNLGHSALALQQDPEKTLSFFQKAARMKHNLQVTEEADFNIALLAHQDKSKTPAARTALWLNFLNRYPQSAYTTQATAYLSDLYLNEFEAQQALAELQRIKQPDRNLQKAQQILSLRVGISAAKNGSTQSLELLDRAIKLSVDPATTLQARYWRGEAYYRNGRMQEAEKDFKQYIAEADPKTEENYPLACYNLGYIAFNAKRYDEATPYFRLFLKHDRNSGLQADALARIADALYYKRQFDEALQTYDQASRLDPKLMPYTLYQKAYIAGIRKEYDEKIVLIDQILSSYPQAEILPQALYEKGRACVLTERREEAIAAYRRLMQQYPKTEEARKAAAETGMIFAQTGRKQEAAEAYRHVVEAYPDSPEALQSLQDLKEIATESRAIGQYIQYADTLQGGRYALPEEQKESLLAEEQEIIRRENEARRMAQADSAYQAKDTTALLQLAADSTEESGAKAHFLICRLLTDQARYEEAEKQVLAYIEKAGNRPYWLARHFILLAEICRLQGRKAEATQYLNGLKEGYTGEDDIPDLIEAEMKKLK